MCAKCFIIEQAVLTNINLKYFKLTTVLFTLVEVSQDFFMENIEAMFVGSVMGKLLYILLNLNRENYTS